MDIVYVYAAHTYLLGQFLDRDINQRTDEYGGNFANRTRLLRELVAETREAVGDRCAVAIRIEVDDEDGGGEAERAELLASLAPMIDLFNVTIADYSQEMGVSRFVKEASLEPRIAHVRKVTGKPVVSVGRFTSPETMLCQVKRGIIDLIGAARPSIADPFLPQKIREGREDDIRECIGCNICYATNESGACDPLHAESDHGRRMAARLAPGADRRRPQPRKNLVVGAGRPGSRRHCRWAGAGMR